MRTKGSSKLAQTLIFFFFNVESNYSNDKNKKNHLLDMGERHKMPQLNKKELVVLLPQKLHTCFPLAFTGTCTHGMHTTPQTHRHTHKIK